MRIPTMGYRACNIISRKTDLKFGRFRQIFIYL